MTFRKLPFFVFFFLVSATFSLAYENDPQRDEYEGQEWGRQSEEEGPYLFNQEKLSKHLENPYLFKQENFSTHLKTQQGNLQVLQKFDQGSHLLRILDNYRIEYLEINPNTFTLPNHWDADSICFVLSGQGAITLLQQENNKETHNLERGDIFSIRANTILFVVNTDNNEKFRVVKLCQPVNVPGQFDGFFSTGGRNPETFYSIFSKDILQAAFNDVEGEQIMGLFQAQDKGPYVEASQEQIKALSGESSDDQQGIPESSQSNKPYAYNIFNTERPSTVSNKYGKRYIVSPDDYKQLEEADIQISYTNITRGAMVGPYYNSKSIQICMVVNGN
ncbi:Vicilin, partial [Thalictrum thalictroides]